MVPPFGWSTEAKSSATDTGTSLESTMAINDTEARRRIQSFILRLKQQLLRLEHFDAVHFDGIRPTDMGITPTIHTLESNITDLSHDFGDFVEETMTD